MFGKGKSIDRMHPIMVDKLNKVSNYKIQREKTQGTVASRGWHIIIPAPKDATIWKKNNSCQWTNYDAPAAPKIIR